MILPANNIGISRPFISPHQSQPRAIDESAWAESLRNRAIAGDGSAFKVRRKPVPAYSMDEFELCGKIQAPIPDSPRFSIPTPALKTAPAKETALAKLSRRVSKRMSQIWA